MSPADRELAQVALTKRAKGEKPSREEAAALHRVQKAREEQQRWEYYASVPQAHYRIMSGRQAKVLAEQAVRYNLPLTGRTLNLPAIIRGFHDLLARNAKALAGEPEKPASLGLERQRLAKAGIAELTLASMQEQLLPRDQVHDHLTRLAGLLRRAGTQLHRKFGEGAAAVLEEALVEFDATVAAQFGPDAGAGHDDR